MPEIGEGKTHRFLMAMSLFYDMGVACHIADNTTQDDFWDFCLSIYPTARRGTERRHFRGEQGLKCIRYLKEHFKGPTHFVEHNHAESYSGVIEKFKKVPAYGEYHTWKWWDFYDRILGMPVAVDEMSWEAMPKEPVSGLRDVAREMGLDATDHKGIARYAVSTLQDLGLMSPPDNDRLVHIAEIETAMCMFHHFLNGSDWVGLDLKSKYRDLSAIDSPTARIMTNNLPEMISRDFFVIPPEVLVRIKDVHPKYKPPKAETASHNLLEFI